MNGYFTLQLCKFPNSTEAIPNIDCMQSYTTYGYALATCWCVLINSYSHTISVCGGLEVACLHGDPEICMHFSLTIHSKTAREKEIYLICSCEKFQLGGIAT